MSVNKYQSHVLVLPEDRADSDIANGFLLHPQLNPRCIQVLPYPGGWKAVIEKFTRSHISTMRQYSERRIVLVIDFDEEDNRLACVGKEIPDDLKDRVFVLGAFSNPEALKSSLGMSFESIGEELSNSCFENTDGLWNHELLKHNKTELDRINRSIRGFLLN